MRIHLIGGPREGEVIDLDLPDPHLGQALIAVKDVNLEDQTFAYRITSFDAANPHAPATAHWSTEDPDLS